MNVRMSEIIEDFLSTRTKEIFSSIQKYPSLNKERVRYKVIIFKLSYY